MTYFCIYCIKGSNAPIHITPTSLKNMYLLYTNDNAKDIETYRVVKNKDGYTMSKVTVDVWYDYMTIVNQFGTIIDHYKHEEE